MSQQPEALRLADWHKAMADEPKRNEAKRDKHRRTEAELRRLHALNAELLKALNAMLTEMGMDEDQWNKHTFNQARAAIAKAQGESNE